MVRRWCGIQQPTHLCHRASVLGCHSLRSSYFEVALYSPLCVAFTAFTRICFWEVSTLHSGGYNETACGANDLTGDPGCSRFDCENGVRAIVPGKSPNRTSGNSLKTTCTVSALIGTYPAVSIR